MSGLVAIALAEKAVGKAILQAMVDELQRVRAWGQMSEMDKGFSLDRLRDATEKIAGQVVNVVAGGEHDYTFGKVDTITIKDGVKVTINAPIGDVAKIAAHSKGASVVVVFAEAERYVEGLEQVKFMANQRDFFELGDHDDEPDFDPPAPAASPAESVAASPDNEPPAATEPASSADLAPEPSVVSTDMTRDEAMNLVATADGMSPEVKRAIATLNNNPPPAPPPAAPL